MLRTFASIALLVIPLLLGACAAQDRAMNAAAGAFSAADRLSARISRDFSGLMMPSSQSRAEA